MEKSLLDKLRKWYDQGKPFVLFAMPNSSGVVGYFSKNNVIYNPSGSNEDGFYLAPFYSDKPNFFIPKKESEVIISSLDNIQDKGAYFSVPNSEESRQDHLFLLNKTIEALRKTEIEKIVISRMKDVPIPSLDILTLAESLFGMYQSTFRYLWYHPETGIWCGATPELLLSTNGKGFATMSLAGTKKILEKHTPIWTDKEREEQEIVTNTILEVLSPFSSEITSSETYNQPAGGVVHLRTDISGTLHENSNTSQLLNALHPTPAVCGNPKEKALDFILQNEGYDRAFYTGYLGVISEEGTSCSYFVNLRSMWLNESKASIFVGGGVTAKSDAEAEWQETVNKEQTMLKVLRPLL